MEKEITEILEKIYAPEKESKHVKKNNKFDFFKLSNLYSRKATRNKAKA